MHTENNRLRPAAFLDRDGVLIKDTGYAFQVDDLHVLPGVADTLKELQKRGFLLIVISNQAGVARGYFSEDDVKIFHQELSKQIEASSGAKIDAFYYCPHHPQGTVKSYAIECDCRKPGTALLKEAARAFHIDWEKSFFVGDRSSDIECAINARIRGFQIFSDQYVMHENPHANIKALSDVLAYLP
ncbi:MAG: HAD family hydrolase [Chitinophagaceae bacterium]|nr:HAD family hydrolase [Oligoflexus sp.]